MIQLFERLDVNEETPVQFVGVHPVKWRPEWGVPTAMFVEIDDPIYEAAPDLLESATIALEQLDYLLENCKEFNKTRFSWAADKLRFAIAKARGEGETE